MMSSAPRRIAILGLGAVALAVLATAGCGGSARQSEGSHQVARPAGLGVDRTLAARLVHRCSSTGFVPSPSLAYAAVAHGTTPGRMGPSGTSHVVGRYPAVDRNGFKTVFGVIGARVHGCRPLWFQVLLPSRPNGSTGWIRASDVRVYTVSSRVVVDLSGRRMSLYRWGSLAFSAPVAVGAPGTPTPVGRFYVDERFLLASANGPFGVAALGISAHSDALKDWVQGGPVALHGTDEPSLIGGAVSHGCVRLTNAAMMRVFRLAPAGTPVLIRR
jgi:L,D-transpeptidase catalytic domain